MEDVRIVNEILKAKTKEEAFILFEKHASMLKGWEILFTEVDGKNKIPEKIQDQVIAGEGYLCNILAGNSIFVLDEQINKSMLKQFWGAFGIDHSVSLDTNIISYLERTIFEDGRQVPPHFLEVVNYLVQNDLNFDPFEYLYENLASLFARDDCIRRSMKAYEILRTIDKTALQKGKICSFLEKEQLDSLVEEDLNQMITFFSEEGCLYIYKTYQLVYALLLKMVLIQLAHPRKAKENKLLLFLEFMQNEIGRICIRELIVANTYFEKGQKLRFFRKIQKASLDNQKNLKNMAWDLFHIRQLERNTVMIDRKNRIYYIPILLTYDQGLSELIHLCSVSRIACNQLDTRLFGTYKEFASLATGEIGRKLSYYFSYEAEEKRTVNQHLTPLIKQLEEQLASISKK